MTKRRDDEPYIGPNVAELVGGIHPTAEGMATIAPRYWPHSMCLRCWNDRHVDPAPHADGFDEETCCWCGALTTSGIYVRAAVADVNECACAERGQ